MDYQIVNNAGKTVYLDWPCFGLLNQIYNWVAIYRKGIGEIADHGFDYNGDEIQFGGEVPNVIERIDPKFGRMWFFEGFMPGDFKTLRVELPTEIEGRDLEDFKTLLNQPLFSKVRLEGNFLCTDMGDRKMDETLLPMFILRTFNEWQPSTTRRTIDYIKKVYPNIPYDAVVRAACVVYRYQTMYRDQQVWNQFTGDDAPINPIAKIGDLFHFIMGEHDPIYTDATWKETLLGYAHYGYTPTYDAYEYFDPDEGEQAPDPIDSEATPYNPRTGRENLISTALVYKGEYDSEFFNSFIERMDGDRIEELLNKVQEAYVERQGNQTA